MSEGHEYLLMDRVDRLKAQNAELLAALERWELFARDNGYTDEDCTFLAATRAAIAKSKGDAA